jgi:hypothetical protein
MEGLRTAALDQVQADEAARAKLEEAQTEAAQRHRQLAAIAEKRSEEAEAAAADVKQHRARAKAKIADVQAGQLVPIRAYGLTSEDIRKKTSVRCRE